MGNAGMVVQEKFYTIDDLWELSQHQDDDEPKRYELDEGELIVMAPAGDKHGLLAMEAGRVFANFVRANKLGKVTAAETGFVLSTNPKTGRSVVRAPDVGFIATARLVPQTGKFFPIPPDLAVEVVSPTDSATQIRRKVRQYVKAGTRMVIVIYPDEQVVDMYQPDQPTLTYGIDETLDGGTVLPGFQLAIRALFEVLD
jgi:Uma2 family endonuclease